MKRPQVPAAQRSSEKASARLGCNPHMGCYKSEFTADELLACSCSVQENRYHPAMPDSVDKLTPAEPRDLADAIALCAAIPGRSACTTPTRSWPRLSPNAVWRILSAPALSS